jgi:hypothetical protein
MGKLKVMIRLKIAMHGYQEGDITEIVTDQNGTPVDIAGQKGREWRNRFKDAGVKYDIEKKKFYISGGDGCLEIYESRERKSDSVITKRKGAKK